MSANFFVSDLHGKKDRYEKLFNKIEAEKPASVFLGGDLLLQVCFLSVIISCCR
jgi:Icc-related predicted phosphoesterase